MMKRICFLTREMLGEQLCLCWLRWMIPSARAEVLFQPPRIILPPPAGMWQGGSLGLDLAVVAGEILARMREGGEPPF